MSVNLQGVVFITGAASGIGRGTVLGLAKYGVQKIAMGDIQETEMQSLAVQVKEEYPGAECLVLHLDVTSEESVQAAVKATVERFGRIDIALNIAGVAGPGGRAPSVGFDQWKATIDVNLHGVWLSQRAEITQMLQQEIVDVRRGRGVIVNMASMLGVNSTYRPEPHTAYAAAKHAVVGLTRTDAVTFAKEGIRINALCPGYVETPLLKKGAEAGHMDGEIERTPMKRMGSVEEIVDCIAFLASPMSSFVCGSTLVVDGGYMAG